MKNAIPSSFRLNARFTLMIVGSLLSLECSVVGAAQLPVRRNFRDFPTRAGVYEKDGWKYEFTGDPLSLFFFSGCSGRLFRERIEVVEAAHPSEHRWMPDGGPGYRVLWRRTFELRYNLKECPQFVPRGR